MTVVPLPPLLLFEENGIDRVHADQIFVLNYQDDRPLAFRLHQRTVPPGKGKSSNKCFVPYRHMPSPSATVHLGP
jgi:hypothetical protein